MSGMQFVYDRYSAAIRSWIDGLYTTIQLISL